MPMMPHRSRVLVLFGWLSHIILPFATHAADKLKVVERWALLIGVDDDANANDLNYCGADQRALKDRLHASGFLEKWIFPMHDETEENRYRPSQRNIEKQLDVVLIRAVDLQFAGGQSQRDTASQGGVLAAGQAAASVVGGSGP